MALGSDLSLGQGNACVGCSDLAGTHRIILSLPDPQSPPNPATSERFGWEGTSDPPGPSQSLPQLPWAPPRVRISSALPSADVNSRSARVLFLLVVPGHLVFLYTISSMQGGHTTLTLIFIVFYMTAALLQVSWQPPGALGTQLSPQPVPAHAAPPSWAFKICLFLFSILLTAKVSWG